MYSANSILCPAALVASSCNAQCMHAGAAARPKFGLPVLLFIPPQAATPAGHPTTTNALSSLVDTWQVLGRYLAVTWPALGRPRQRWPELQGSSIEAAWRRAETVCSSSWTWAASKQATAATPPLLHLNRAGPAASNFKHFPSPPFVRYPLSLPRLLVNLRISLSRSTIKVPSNP